VRGLSGLNVHWTVSDKSFARRTGPLVIHTPSNHRRFWKDVVHPPSRVDGSIHSLVLSDRQTNLGWHFSVYNNKTYDRQTLALYVRWKSCPYSGSVAVWTPDPGPRTPDHTTSRLDEFRLPKDTGNQKSHRSDFVDTIQCDTGRRPIRLCPLKKKWPPTKTPTVRRSSHDASDLRCSGIVGMTRTPPIDTNKPQSKCLGLGIH